MFPHLRCFRRVGAFWEARKARPLGEPQIDRVRKNRMDTRRTIGEILPKNPGSRNRRRPGTERLTTVILVLFTGLRLGTVVAHAQDDATWSSTPAETLTPGTANWNTLDNWVPPIGPAIVPTGTATLGTSNIRTLTFSENASVGTLNFKKATSAYNFNITGTSSLTITGTGIVNPLPNSPVTFTVARNSNNHNNLNFENESTAANSAITNFNGGLTQFSTKSTAAFATIHNNSTVFSEGPAGETDFLDASTAANSVITNNIGATQFSTTSTAANATITNNGGITTFSNTSTAANSTIVNNVGTSIFAFRGQTTFNDASTAGAATIITNNDANTLFNNGSTAGTATITSNKGGETVFTDTSTADNSTIVTSNRGMTIFLGTSSGGQARFITNSGGLVDISDLSSSGMTAGSIEGAGTYKLGSKALTVGLNNLSTEVSGIIEDGGTVVQNAVMVTAENSQPTTGGSLIKAGAGTLTLSGINTYSGGTIVNAGTLMVDSAHALGTGDVTVNGGVLAADPQQINVLGNYTQNAGGTLQLQVSGVQAGQFDSLNVNGNAALGGTLKLTTNGFTPQAGNQVTLVITGGAISGKFAQFVDPFTTGSGIGAIDLVYSRNGVLLQFLAATAPISPGVPTVPVVPTTPGVPVVISTVDFASFAFTPNQSAAGNLLDAVQLDPKAANLISFLNQEPFANLPNDLQKISPDGLTSFYEISFSNANIQKLTLESRLDDIHNGSNGFSSNMNVNGTTVNLYDRADADGKSSKAVVEPVLQHTPDNRWGVWMTGFGDFVDVDGDGNGRGYNFTTGGVSLGIDYRLTDQLAIGVMGDYSHTWTSLKPGHIDVDSGRGGMYATWFSHGIYLNGAIYGGYNSYDSGRSGLGGLANGSTEGAEWSTFVGGGYDFHLGQLTVGPIASLQYTDVGIDSFSENGSLAPLAIHSGSAESLRSDVGFRTFYPFQIGKIVLEPSLKAAWEHEYKYSALPITAGFAGIPGPSATFFGPSEGHDSAVVSAGVSVQLTHAISTYVNYDGQLGRGNYDSNAVTGGVRISF
jgi:outer membrane autotransporter protein